MKQQCVRSDITNALMNSNETVRGLKKKKKQKEKAVGSISCDQRETCGGHRIEMRDPMFAGCR